jgi:hypothetical protein
VGFEAPPAKRQCRAAPKAVARRGCHYVERYKVDEMLFPYTQCFLWYLITEIAQKAGMKKKVSAQFLRNTCAIRQIKRGEGVERVLMRLGLSETIWEDAKIKYEKLSAGEI